MAVSEQTFHQRACDLLSEHLTAQTLHAEQLDSDLQAQRVPAKERARIVAAVMTLWLDRQKAIHKMQHAMMQASWQLFDHEDDDRGPDALEMFRGEN